MAKIQMYGWQFDDVVHPLEREFLCIRRGGAWKRKDGEIAGMGLPFHYRKAIGILWPEFAQHRWFHLILDQFLKREWIGISGPKDSGKTSSLTVILLCDYYCFPNITSIILSSTTMKALKNRAFGEFTMRHRAARKRIEWLPGHMIESECRIVTDDRDENVDGRDVRNGIIGIPVKEGGRNALDDIIGIKNKRKRWFIDEVQQLSAAALDGTANFMQNNSDVKFIGAGNPSDTMDAHGKLCQPHSKIGGWDGGIDQQGKTKVWETTFDNGVCIQLPGSDSPNYDVPDGAPVPYPFLMTREKMRKDANTWGPDDWHYMMFNEGRWPRGQGSNRVITRQLCITHGALKQPVWLNESRTRISFLDAAYRGVGGDRCVFGQLDFGYEIPDPGGPQLVSDGLAWQQPQPDNARQIIALVDMQVIPIKSSDFESPEDQIVVHVMRECKKRGIGPENFFFDSGMRTSLVTAFSRIWSPAVNSLDFGGPPSDNMVSNEIQIRCKEYYFNFVTELWYTVRLIIESSQFRGLTEDVVSEGCLREFKRVSGNKIQVETKADMKAKCSFSPDLFDALVTGVFGAMKRGFRLKRKLIQNTEERDQQWKRDLEQRAKKWRTAGQLI